MSIDGIRPHTPKTPNEAALARELNMNPPSHRVLPTFDERMSSNAFTRYRQANPEQFAGLLPDQSGAFDEIEKTHGMFTAAIGRHVERLVVESIVRGFGDCDADLGVDEYEYMASVCPLQPCAWRLVTEWRRRGGYEITRRRGLYDTDQASREHILTHPRSTWTYEITVAMGKTE